MTESEVIEKLEFFKKAIINLKNENSSLAEAASNFEIENGKTIENYEKQILSLKEENKKLNEENKALCNRVPERRFRGNIPTTHRPTHRSAAQPAV